MTSIKNSIKERGNEKQWRAYKQVNGTELRTQIYPPGKSGKLLYNRGDITNQ